MELNAGPFSTYIKMVSIQGGTVSAAPAEQSANAKGIFSNCGLNAKGNLITMTVSDFQIAECETPYSVWYEVKRWAEKDENGYTFGNDGRQGKNGVYGDIPRYGGNEPVTCVRWEDAVVWCNAYSEKEGKTPVYYYKNEVLKNAASTESYEVIRAVIKDGDGYRLPAEVEWEYAARGGKPSGAEWDFRWAGTNAADALSTYAVYDANGTAAVKSKAPNSAALYDMSGNVWEWCFDGFATVPQTSETDYNGVFAFNHVIRGGSWQSVASACYAAYRNSFSEYNYFIGFRVARTPCE